MKTCGQWTAVLADVMLEVVWLSAAGLPVLLVSTGLWQVSAAARSATR